jgi:hypothetical protein
MDKFLECKSSEIFDRCPICTSKIESRPQAGTHAFTIIYECGTEIDYPIGHDGASYGATCTGEIERFDMSKIKVTKEMVKKMRKILL